MDPFIPPYVPGGWAAQTNKRARSPSPDCVFIEARRAPRSARLGSPSQAPIKRELSVLPRSPSPEFVIDEARSDPRFSGSAQAYIKRESYNSKRFSTPLSSRLPSVASMASKTNASSPLTSRRSTVKPESPSPAPNCVDFGENRSCHDNSETCSDDGLEDPHTKLEWEMGDRKSESEGEDTKTDTEIEDNRSQSEDDHESEPEVTDTEIEDSRSQSEDDHESEPELTDTEIEDSRSQSEDDHESELEVTIPDIIEDQQDLETSSIHLNNDLKPKKKRRPAAKNPREYFQRKKEDRLEKLVGKSSKHRKTKREKQMEIAVFQSLQDYEHIAPNEAQQQGPLPHINSRTKKDQMDQLLGTSVAGMKNNTMSRNELAEALKSFGLGNMKAVNGKWRHKNMTTPLLHYQVYGVSRMLERECSEDGALGGILADAMGLGKTVETIALIVANPPPASTPKAQRATLIIVPPAVLYQWRCEILKHAGKTLVDDSIIIYRSSYNYKRIFLVNADIVLTTYHEVYKSCPFPSKTKLAEMKEIFEDVDLAIENWISNSEDDAGLLHKHTWYRVVIDEAHTMKNRKSRLSHAANALDAKHRWTLSGTPVMNGVHEFFSPFRFLKVPGIGNYAAFKNAFCNPKNEESHKKLCQTLSELMIRRTMQDTFLGHPLVHLPQAHSHVLEVKFSAQELILYRALEEKFRCLINADLAEDDPNENLTYYSVQLTRLRQCTSHPILIEPTIKEVFEIEELEALKTRLEVVGFEIADRIPSWIKRKRQDEVLRAVTLEAKKYAEQYPICPLCNDMAEDPQMINLSGCHHIFCEVCINYDAERQVSEGAEDSKCPECSVVFEISSSLKALDLAEPEPSTKHSILYKKLRKGQDSLKYIPKTCPSAWTTQIDGGNATFFQTAKLKASTMQLETWIHENPDDKIIVFVQWRQLATLIGRNLEDRDIGFLYYTGDMNTSKRNLAVHKFRDDANIKIMIAGLKCGGVGLNLAFANRVISLDLWWNICVENQAFGRVYRLGQDKETYFERVIIRKSVDSRLLKIQQRKCSEIGKAMGEKLTAEELFGLFGKVVKGANGKMHVVADYGDDSDDDDDDGGYN